MATKNYGVGYREMGRAGCIALQRAGDRKTLSKETVSKYSFGWKQFAQWAKAHNVKQMERITPELVQEYGRELAQMADDSEIESSTAQDRLTAVNRTLQLSGRKDWKSISSVKQCGIAKRSHIREGTPDALNREVYQARLAKVSSSRGVAICELARNLGLRSKEASLLDARKALKQATENGFVRIKDGTKGGRLREIPITSDRQLQALRVAAQAQGTASAVMPPDVNWKQWRQGELRIVREAIGGLHELRSAFACERYESITGHGAPCTGAQILDRDVDYGARLIVSEELGHGRIDVVSEYVGGRK